jgi:sugar (glycoside-pentoside-hexuronide) transporter
MKDGFSVTVKEKLAYGLGDFAINIAYTTLGFYIVFFLVNVAGVPAAWAGLIFLIARGWDAITDFFMGTISDRTRSRFGRRRPYILFGAIPLGISFILLWIVPFQDPKHLFIYYLFITLLFNTAFTVVAIPYNSLLPELSQNYDERTSISGYRMALTFVGNLVAAAGVAVIVDVLYGGKEHYRESYPVMGIIFACIMITSLVLTFIGTKERTKAESTYPGGLLESLKSILQLREFRFVLGMFLFNMIGFDLIQAIFIFFLKDVITVSEDMTFVIMGIPLIVAALAAPFWIKMGEKLEKRKAYIVAAIYFTLSLLLCLVSPVGNINAVIGIAVLAGIGISASQIIPFSIIPDIIEIDEYENGSRREGAFYGIIMFLYKVASAIAVGLATALLGYFGYVEGASGPQPESALTAIRYLMGVGPGIFFLISALFVKMLPLSRARFNEVKEALEKRKSEV